MAKTKIRLLDCTLRDGGFVNDWNFGSDSLINIYSRLSASGVEIIELGMFNTAYAFDKNRSIMPHTDYLKDVFPIKNKTKAKLLAMVIMGECPIENIGPKSQTPVDGLRIVFKKSAADKAFVFAEECRNRGYEIFLQPASVTDYSEQDMINLVEKTNKFRPSALYIVDTYGLLDKEQLFFYADIIDKHLAPDIDMGYHSHNNFQQSYTTAIEFIERPKKHNIVVDCTLFGIGKTTGNLNTELIVDYMNKKHNTAYNNAQILEAIESEILKIKDKFGWGYSLNGFIAASNKCHPTYVKYLLNKKTLSVESVSKILSQIPAEKRTTYNEELVENLYRSHQDVHINDEEAYKTIKSEIGGRSVLILAPGASLIEEKDKVLSYIKKEKPCVFAINSVPDFIEPDYVFVSNARRYNQLVCRFMETENKKYGLITTSNITEAGKTSKLVFNYGKLKIEEKNITDNATLFLIKILNCIGINNISVAGFDGFSAGVQNYHSDYIALCNIEDADAHNEAIKKYIKKIQGLKLNFLTKSKYNNGNTEL